MQLFLDSALPTEIRHGLDHWDIDGVTTNPRHVATTGRPLLSVLEEIAGLVEGTEKPVSVEVNPHLEDADRIIAEGEQLARLSPNFVIKVAISEAGCSAVRELTARGIRTNVTLVFSTAQAWHAARCGATYVSPFIGWREAHGDNGLELVSDVAQMLSVGGYGTQIIAAAVRNAEHLAAAAMAGAHCATAGVAVIRDSFKNPYTDMGARVFCDAWDQTPPGDPPVAGR